MLLSDEAIKQAWLDAENSMGFMLKCPLDRISKENYDEGEATHGKFQAKAQLKAVVEGLKKEDARMYTGTLDNPDMLILKVHKDFWQSLLEEVQ